jgi:DNA-binding CsgD family transcriptional regulator
MGGAQHIRGTQPTGNGLRRPGTSRSPQEAHGGQIVPLGSTAAECSRIGDGGDAALWADARRQWEACKNCYHAAYARFREAEALLGAGANRAEVATLVREAHAVADDLGARPLLEQLQFLARRARLDLDDGPAPGATPNRVLESFELTPRESEVLALLASGLTNREIGAELFISNKTASVHVSRILSKLSVPNRAAAAAFAQRLGVAPTDLRH